jgi:integrase
MRNPNGYGSVVKLGGKRRKPFCARVTAGWSDDGKQLYKNIGYYGSAVDANLALSDYHRNPYSIDASKVTFKDMYEKYTSTARFVKLSRSSHIGYQAAYRACPELHEMRMVDIKKNHMQIYLDDDERGHGSKRKMLVLFKSLFAFAAENDIVSKEYSDYLKLPTDFDKVPKVPFTESEIFTLFENADRMAYIDVILIMIFTGVRIGELLDIKSIDVDINERFMVGGLKTAASKNRLIPINKKIIPFVRSWLDQGGEYLIAAPNGGKTAYWNFYNTHWKNIMEKLAMVHTPHDTRHTCATLLDNAGANKVARQRILGHASKDVTDKTYTHKDKIQLLKAIDLI